MFRAKKVNYEYGKCFVEAVHTMTGQTLTFEGDTIVCTASIGAIKEGGSLEFNPPLPKWKTDAFDNIKMGNYLKIYCRFAHPWWKNHEYIFFADECKGKYAMWMPINGNTVMCCVAGEEADRVETLSEDELKNEILEFLDKHTGKTPLVEVKLHKWREDPDFKGSYSVLTTNCFNENPVMFHWLTEPVATISNGQRFRPTLHFAGEAFDFNYGGQLQGAFSSGRDTAIRIINELNKENEELGQKPFQEIQLAPRGYVFTQQVVTTTST